MMNKPLFVFDNSFAQMPTGFYQRWLPTPVRAPKLIAFNQALAEELRMEDNATGDAVRLAAVFSGNEIPCGAEPLAQAYAGHQFGNFVPQLGDGRAILLGEVVDHNGIRRDIQLKGSGPTPFSRNGDGRAALGPVMREYIVSEAMHRLGVPTTRSLAMVATGEMVARETKLPGAILTRVASSHIRVGTFQYFAARGDEAAIKRLADYVIERHYPHANNTPQPYAALLVTVIDAQAKLIARWMQIGFIHGVMNTDNMAVSGETIDYGPCAFMDQYNPMQVYSFIDRNGRYAFANQPLIALWNLTRFAECLLPLLNEKEDAAAQLAQQLLEGFLPHYTQHWMQGMREKIGLLNEQENDQQLIIALLDAMQQGDADYTLSFCFLADAAEGNEQNFLSLFHEARNAENWLKEWRARLQNQPQSLQEIIEQMRHVNPLYIPRNHRIEQAIAAAINQEDFGPMQRLQAALIEPYNAGADYADLAQPPKLSERVEHTFCGT